MFPYHVIPAEVGSKSTSGTRNAECASKYLIPLTKFGRLKCNREQPCQNCTARFEQETCKYRGSKNGPGSGISRRHENEDADPMQERINRLESLVKTLVAQSQEKSQSEDSSPSKSAGSSPDNHRLGNGYDMAAGTKNEPVLSFNAGTTLINERQSVYKTANDWSDVLQEVRC